MDAMKWISSVVLLLVAVCALLKEGLCITCYMCNSAETRNWKSCVDMGDKAHIFEQDCDLLPEARSQEVNYTVCRKMYQTIYDAEGYEEHRIIRQCGSESPLNCMTRTRPNALRIDYCHCDQDLCNAAPIINPSSFFLAALCIVVRVFAGA